MNRFLISFLVVIAVGSLRESHAVEPSIDLGNVTESHIMIPMRDGVKLSTFIYTPKTKGPWPVLYEQRYADLKGTSTRKAFANMAAAGYVVAAQNFRGAGVSEGVWVGYRALGWGEKRDGYDTVEWLAKQAWSTGKVGTFGSSQAGFAQNFLAVTRPPHLTCQYMIDTGLSLFHEGYRIGGATRPERFKAMGSVCRNPEDNLQLLKEWFAHPLYDSYWADEDCSRHFDKMDVPCFTVGSWFDFMCVGSVESYIGRQHRAGANSKGRQQLLLGPWLHGRFKETNKTGELTFPANARFAMDAHMIRWFDHYLKGVDNGVERDDTIRYYVMGAVGESGAPGNEWRTAKDWPISATDQAMYLHSGGRLSALAPTEATSSTTFLADPIHPNTIPAGAFPGAKDAREFESQAEVRTFTTEVLTEPIEWTGKVKAELYFSSTAKDTDVIVRVCDVYPDGRSILLMDYIRRARYREGYEKEVMLEPGKPTKVAFDIGWVSQVFNKGHRIRVTLAGTGAHFYEPNPNTGEPLTLDFPTNTVVARNTVYHQQSLASRLIAPVRVLKVTETERTRIERRLSEFAARFKILREKQKIQEHDLADVEVYSKAIHWALRYESNLTQADFKLIGKAADSCEARLTALENGKRSWSANPGILVRGYVSVIDGSTQPYGVIVPQTYQPGKPSRLDVVLHGSTKPSGMSELRFMSRFEMQEGQKPSLPDQNFIELHPLGRVENGYRWAGESDVFEAIEDVAKKYTIDRDRIVLRGMSMGASGTWHLGLKHPDRFVALGPYCGYVDTHQFSETPLPNFQKVGRLPHYQEKTLHILDSVDYAANAGVVPAIACIGEKDVFFQAHVIMGRAMAKERLSLVNLISPGTGHVIDPVTHQEQMRRIEIYSSKGLDHSPRHIRFVTWSLKYGRCHWIQVLGLTKHYERAEMDATLLEDRSIDILEPKNISKFAILAPITQGSIREIRVDGNKIERLQAASNDGQITLLKKEDRWTEVRSSDPSDNIHKRPGLQGPIDDAFTTPFLCVRGTGSAWNPAVQRWADASLKQFSAEWSKYFRGDLQIKDDTSLTIEDMKRYNLILFGDPGSNLWISRILPSLPIQWTKDECVMGTIHRPAAEYAPKLIYPNPLSPGRYVVLNSGHTFGEKELSSLNYLLFPRLGDWAMIKIPGDNLNSESVIDSGFFDEHWRFSRE